MSTLGRLAKSLVTLGAASLVLVACNADPVAPAVEETLPGVLVYGLSARHHEWPNNLQPLSIIRPDGTGGRLYREQLSAYLTPSPDLSRVAFSSRGFHIGDWSGPQIEVPLVAESYWASPATWSPNGSWITYQQLSLNGPGQLLMAVGTSGEVTNISARLAGETSCSGDVNPALLSLNFVRWSSANRIEFRWIRCGAPNLTLRINANGSELEQIQAASAGWLSPDGTRLLSLTGRVGLDRQASLSRADGGDAQALGTSGADYQMVDWQLPYPWSPDGRHVAVLQPDGACQTLQPVVFAVDGSREGRLSPEHCWELHSWSPDGNWVAATRQNDPRGSVIHLLKLDGSDQRQLVVGPPSLKVGDVAWLREP